MNTTEKKAEALSRLIDRLYAVGMMVMGTATLVLSVSALAGLALPDWLTRALGLVNLLAFPLILYTSVKKLRRGKDAPPPRAAAPGKKKAKKKKRK